MSEQSKLKFSDLRAAHRQARRQARLGRVFSPYAFAGVLDQPIRWHLHFDGREVSSTLRRVKAGTLEWLRGPEISPAELFQKEILQEKCREIAGVKTADLSKLGVVLHLADQVEP